jgi:hypothetical protein
MRLWFLMLTAILAAAPAAAQPSAAGDPASSLPVSLDKIREGLEKQTPPLTFHVLDDQPTFRVEVKETRHLQDLVSDALKDVKAVPVPAGGVYWNEMMRQVWNPVDHPLNQPYAAFNQGELLTILIENLAGKYLAGKALDRLTSAERAMAVADAKEEVRQSIGEYCAAQPNRAAIIICANPR